MAGIAGTVSKSWMAEAIGVAFNRDYYFDPASRFAVDRKCHAQVGETLGDLGLFFTESNLGRVAYHDPRQVLVGGIQPNMIVGMLLGAEFIPHDQADADISPTPLAGRELADLPAPESLLEHDLVRLFDEQFRNLKNDTDADVNPVPPFFWDSSGRVAIHGAITSAQKLFGESIFLDMVTSPDQVAEVFDWITDISIALVRHFAKLADRKITEVHIGECSSCMISPALFEQFVVPTASRVGAKVGPVRFHSCGASDHLLEACRKIENLRSLDVGGNTSVAKIRSIFGPKFSIDIAPLVDDLRSDQPDQLLAWADRVLAEDGAAPTIVYHLESGYPLENVRRLQAHVLQAMP